MSARAISFECDGVTEVGIFHPADANEHRCGIVMVVGGGPQYRVGGHRQLVLWSRRLAREGFPVLRFDYRGMGDSHGEFLGFEHVDDDIRAAIDRLCAEAPDVREIVLWGECDAAAAILFYAHRDPRVTGLVLLNPWARTEASQARVVLRHYYARRLTQRSFWEKVIGLRFDVIGSLRSALSLASKAKAGSKPGGTVSSNATQYAATRRHPLSLPERLLDGYTRFGGQVLVVMSGRDFIAKEFDDLTRQSEDWHRAFAVKPPTRHDIEHADHTFSSAAQREQVVGYAVDWLATLADR